MRAIVHRNLNRALPHAARLLRTEGVEERTRAGLALVHPDPVCTTLRQPTERVLLSPARRANPFFHLFEAFWMLAGRHDGRWLDTYVHDFSERFGEPDDEGNLWGAYGWRWRNHFQCVGKRHEKAAWEKFSLDQIEVAVKALTRDPESRRVVIAMWDPAADLGESRRDHPCNTHLYLRLRPRPADPEQRDLVLTVCCRSNDLVWGLFGSNAVHFSVLQEYLAWRLDAGIGEMHVLSNNLHVYRVTEHLVPPNEADYDRYSRDEVAAIPLFAGANLSTFHAELTAWMAEPTNTQDLSEPFTSLLVPMARVHAAAKSKDYAAARALLPTIAPTDWRAAAELWVHQRRGY